MTKSQKGRGKGDILKPQKEIKEDNKMSAMNINKNNFHEEVLNSDKPVLLDFSANYEI